MVPEVTNETIDGALASFRSSNVDGMLKEFIETQPGIYENICKEYSNTPALCFAISTAMTTWYLIKRQIEINELEE